MKKNSFIVGIAIVLVLAIKIFGIVAWSPIQKSVVAQSNSLANDEQATATLTTSDADNPTTLPTTTDQGRTEQSVFNPEISATNKNLTAVAREVNLDPKNPSVTICSDLPTIADWLPIFSVKLNDQAVGVMQISVLNSDEARLEINRCYMVSLSPESFNFNNISGTLVVSMDYFKILLPEKLPSDSELVANTSVETQKQGINFKIQEISHGFNVIITQKPAEMSDETASRIVFDLLNAQAGRVDGPWVFTIRLG